jgi:hypothetical protein
MITIARGRGSGMLKALEVEIAWLEPIHGVEGLVISG